METGCPSDRMVGETGGFTPGRGKPPFSARPHSVRLTENDAS